MFIKLAVGALYAVLIAINILHTQQVYSKLSSIVYAKGYKCQINGSTNITCVNSIYIERVESYFLLIVVEMLIKSGLCSTILEWKICQTSFK